jgi:hypothetical protein
MTTSFIILERNFLLICNHGLPLSPGPGHLLDKDLLDGRRDLHVTMNKQ